MNIKERELIERIVSNKWKGDANTLGPDVTSSAVEDTLENRQLPEMPPDSGRMFDYTLALKTIVEATTFVKLCLEIYKITRDLAQTKTKLKETEATRSEEIRNKTEEVLLDLIDYVEKGDPD